MSNQDTYSDKPALEYLFQPKSIAIVGVSIDSVKFNTGQMFLKALINAGYKGKIYPVNPSGGEVTGLKIYPSIKDIPGKVDYAISAIPAQLTPQVIADCIAKGVRAVHLYTAGFSELGEEEGKRLELQITTIARQRDIRVIGPNCMGLYCPKTGLSFSLNLPTQSGSVGYAAQSGGNSIYGVREGATRGVYFSKVISYGNACDLNETDFLDYLAHDPETKIITAYIEGVKNGARFMKVLKEATEVKPVIIYKGGITKAGVRAAASHTGAIAGSERIWDSLLKQAGAIQVHSVEELVDIALLFTYISPPKGKNMAIIGIGGGNSVQAADACASAGLNMPALPIEIRQRIKDIIGTEAGLSFQNPLDIYRIDRQDVMDEAIRVVANFDQIDSLFMHIPFDIGPTRANIELILRYIKSVINSGKEINKRTAVVLHSITTVKSQQAASEAQTALYKAGFPVYPSVSRAATAISKFIQYHEQHQRR